MTATRAPAPTPPYPRCLAAASKRACILQPQPAATCRSNLAGSFPRLGGLGADNPIAWRASLRGHCVGWAFWVSRFGWHITDVIA